MIKRLSMRVHNQSGFILTIEAVLIFTILGIGLFVGIVAVRDAWFKYALSQQDQSFYVFDSSDPVIVIGKVAGFDEHEAPLVPFIDYDVSFNGGDPVNHRALIGVRDDRFTSRQPVFYSLPNCTGSICISGAGIESSYNRGVDNIAATGGIGYLYALQGVSYAIGAGDGGAIKGRLYRQTAAACGVALQSAWDSQRVVAGSPCISVAVGPAGFFTAQSVDRGPGENVLDPLTAGFYTNMISTPSTTYTAVLPGDENTSF